MFTVGKQNKESKGFAATLIHQEVPPPDEGSTATRSIGLSFRLV